MTFCALAHIRGKIPPSRVTHTGNLLLLRARLEVPMGKSRAASSTHTPDQNDLLAALPAVDYERLLPDLELVPLPRSTQALITQMAQTAVCNRHHSVEQQLCRWLLLSLDRLPSNELSMTQELIANMLGVRREGVTEAAGKLQTAGLIQYNRGHIKVLDRPKLEDRVCECYAVVKRESDRLLPERVAA